MSDETIANEALVDNQVLDHAIAVSQEMTVKFLDVAHVNSVYGKPIRHGETLMIPTAEVLSVAGFGVGGGSGSGVDPNKDTSGSGTGAGGGGGGSVHSRPVAVVIASPEGVRIEPVVDVTKIGLAALTAAGFIFSMLLRMRSPHR